MRAYQADKCGLDYVMRIDGVYTHISLIRLTTVFLFSNQAKVVILSVSGILSCNISKTAVRDEKCPTNFLPLIQITSVLTLTCHYSA